nr:FKBP-type peptidyl-prolyl cis-trans isomerase [Vampirovibrio chlorellavorus]
MTQKYVGLLLGVAVCASSLVILSGCDEKAASQAAAPQKEATASQQASEASETSETGNAASVRTVSGIRIEDVEVGDGTEAKRGNTVSVNYLGTLASNGRKFDSSYDRNQPFTFKLGSGQVIEGWEKGIVGMKEGGKRILTIPPEKAYGPNGYPPVIPANATLQFEVELVEVQ